MSRTNSDVAAKELESKRLSRTNPDVAAKELESKILSRTNPDIATEELENKRKSGNDPLTLEKERVAKQTLRYNSTGSKVYDLSTKRGKRKSDEFVQHESQLIKKASGLFLTRLYSAV